MHFAKHFIATGRQKPTSIPNRTASTTFKVSISGKGKGYDNTAVETFFKTIKAELICRHPWETWRKAEIAIFEYINGFYNPRRHSAPGWKSPVAFDRKVAYTATWGGTIARQVHSFFSLPFSSSKALSRFASDGSMPPTYFSGLLTSFLFFDHRYYLFVRKSCLHLSVLLSGQLQINLWGF